jgi:hypothetical protein
MVHVVDADIRAEPAKYQRQIVVRAAVQCRRVEGPVVAASPVCLLELMLLIKNHTPSDAANIVIGR